MKTATCEPPVRTVPLPECLEPAQIIDALVLQFGTAPKEFISYLYRAGDLSWRANCNTGRCSLMLRSLLTQRDMVKAAMGYHQQLVDVETMRDQTVRKMEEAAQSTVKAAEQDSEAAQGEYARQETACATTRQDSRLEVIFDSQYLHVGFTQYDSLHTTNETGNRQQDDILHDAQRATETYNLDRAENNNIQRVKDSALDEMGAVGHLETQTTVTARQETKRDANLTTLSSAVGGVLGATLAVGGLVAAPFTAGASLALTGAGIATGLAAGSTVGTILGGSSSNSTVYAGQFNGGALSHGEYSVGRLGYPNNPENPLPPSRDHFARTSYDTSYSLATVVATDYTNKRFTREVLDTQLTTAFMSKTWAITERGQTDQRNEGSSVRTRRYNADGEQHRDEQGSYARNDEKYEQGTSTETQQATRQMGDKETREMSHNRNPWSQHWDALLRLYNQINRLVGLSYATITMQGRQYVSYGAGTRAITPPRCGTVMGRY